MCAPSELQFDALREGGGTREAGSTVAVSLVVLYRVGTKFGKRGGHLNRRRARRGLNPCARESKVWTGRFLREKLMSDHGHFSSYGGHKERPTGKIRWAFSRMQSALDGWMLARAPAPPAQGFHHHGPLYFIFSYFCTMCGLEKLGLVDQNWLDRNLSALLLRMLVVGRRQQI